jgi:hypothetical protein
MKLEGALMLHALDHELDAMNETRTRDSESVVGNLKNKDARQSILGPQCGTPESDFIYRYAGSE